MNDRELLELAAKAAGMTGWSYTGALGMCKMINSSRPDATGSIGPNWNPLTDDGDALRLAVKLKLTPMMRDFGCDVTDFVGLGVAYEPWSACPFATTRRAIVRAAAEIGRQMQEGGAA